MKFVQQSDRLPVRNFVPQSNDFSKKHGPLLPSTMRCLICGPSNCGKTNAMISLLISENGLKFENVYVYSKSLYQSKYQFLSKILRSIKGINYFEYSDADDVIDPTVAHRNSVFVFDDVICDKQDIMRSYFTMGRHKSIDPFYLCQTYSKIPKHLIRDNANFLILFKMDDLNLKHVYDDHVNTDMTYNQFKEMCSDCWRNKYDFLTIDKDSDLKEGRYRKGFDIYINIT